MEKILEDLKHEGGYGSVAFNELLHEVANLKKSIIETATDLHEAGYYEEAEAFKKMDWGELLNL